jgi:hypothetical protein
MTFSDIFKKTHEQNISIIHVHNTNAQYKSKIQVHNTNEQNNKKNRMFLKIKLKKYHKSTRA